MDVVSNPCVAEYASAWHYAVTVSVAVEVISTSPPEQKKKTKPHIHFVIYSAAFCDNSLILRSAAALFRQ